MRSTFLVTSAFNFLTSSITSQPAHLRIFAFVMHHTWKCRYLRWRFDGFMNLCSPALTSKRGVVDD